MEKHIMIEESDYTEQREVKRTIVDLIDIETGEFVNANEILSDEKYNDKAIFAKIKETLILAQKTGIHKYTCAICNQPVRLNSRQYADCGHISNFFSHFSYSNACPAKTASKGSITAHTKMLINRFKKSDVHETISKRLVALLSEVSDVTDLRFMNVSDEETFSDNQTFDVEFTYKDTTDVGIDFQLYTTFASKIFHKSYLAKKLNRCTMWVLPFFSPAQQAICAKDIYYRNRRNVFVFDSKEYYTNNASGLNSFKSFAPQYPDYRYAQEESIKAGRLMLNCFWQVPSLQDGKFKIEWHNRLVTWEELSFDKETGDIFYHDSDKDFNNTMDSELHETLLKWEEEIRIRWAKFENVIAEREAEATFDPNETKEGRKLRLLKSRIENGERLTAFIDKSIGKVGFKLGEDIIIKPQFHKVKRFDENYISVVKLSPNGKVGAINLLGKRVFNCKYDGLDHLVKDLYVYTSDKQRGLISLEKGEVLPPRFLGFVKVSEDRILIHNGYHKTKWGNGEKVHRGYRVSDLNGTFISPSYNIIRRLSEDYLYGEGWKGQLVLMDVDGNIIYPDFQLNLSNRNIKVNAIVDEVMYLSYETPDKHGCKTKVCTFDGKTLYSSTKYDKVLPYDDSSYEAFIGEKSEIIVKS